MKRLISIAFCIFLSQISSGQVMMMFSSDSLTNITSPLDLDSLFYWFAADQGVTDSLGGAIATDEGVGTWADLSGNGRDLAPGANRPIWKGTGGPGSKPCIQFTSTDTYLVESSSSYWNSDQVTFIIVAKVANATANQVEIYGARDIGASTKQWNFATSASATSYRHRMIAFADGTTAMIDYWTPKSSSFQCITFTATTNTNTSSLHVDGATQTLNVNATQTGIYDGNETFYCGFRDQSISEIIVYSRALSSTERAAIENYLNKKYDLY